MSPSPSTSRTARLSTSSHDLKTLILSRHPLLVIETTEEERVRKVLAAVAADLRMPVFSWSVTSGLRRGDAPAPHGTTDPVALMRHLGTLTVPGLFVLQDFAPFLTDPTLIRAVRETVQRFAGARSTIVVTGDPVRLPDEVAPHAVTLRLELPNEAERRAVVGSVLRSLEAQHRINVTMGPDELEDLVRALAGLTLNQARQAVAYAILADGQLGAADVARITKRKAELLQARGPIEYFPLEDNRFELGGFPRLKAWLARARLGFTREAAAWNLPPPRGVLIVGVQGCGKSLAAKAIARDWRLPLLKLDAAGLYDKFVGESERNLRQALELAESMAPVVLWIDEIEKGLTDRTSTADGGLGRRLLGFLLTWLQERRASVFVAATANDLGALPPELLRKGRFDEIFFVDLPDLSERHAILRIHLELRNQQPDRFDVPRLAEATDGFSGAEIEQAVIASLYRALHLGRQLDTALLEREIADTRPLSESRREDIERLRSAARDRFVPVR